MSSRSGSDPVVHTPGHAIRLSQLSAFGESGLYRLLGQRRVFDRLDWWLPNEWLSSDAFCLASSEGTVQGALLTVPVSFDDIQRLNSTRSSIAWLRWCALSDNVSASAVMRSLFEYSGEVLTKAGIHRVMCILDRMHWLLPYLSEAAFSQVDEVVTMRYRGSEHIANDPIAPGDILLRSAMITDLAAISRVDSSAFEEQWHYPIFVLQRALETNTYFKVAQREEAVVGYLLASYSVQEAHITRIAVRPDLQGHGIGAWLLADALRELWQGYGAQTITINTQASNTISQKLYRRFGFGPLYPPTRVMQRSLVKAGDVAYPVTHG